VHVITLCKDPCETLDSENEDHRDEEDHFLYEKLDEQSSKD
jgi:hypothetical protein